MAFLDNSGDIILDAVLTDLGRKRMAAGNFNIAKFALGDEEVNYELWNSEDARGSAFYDLEIMQTPILEAFTSDQSLMKSRLVTLVDDSLLYMPIMRVNDRSGTKHSKYATYNGFYLSADTRTFDLDNRENLTNANTEGFLRGTRGFSGPTSHVCIDQGIDAGDSNMTIADGMSGELLERAYIVKVDHRLLVLDGFVGVADNNEYVTLREQFIDDDGIATYYIVDSQNRSPISGPRDQIGDRERHLINEAGRDSTRLGVIQAKEKFSGPLGSVLRLSPRASVHVARGDSLFTEIGNFTNAEADKIAMRGGTIDEYHFIDTVMSISGATTGFSVDVPIRIIKGTKFNQ